MEVIANATKINRRGEAIRQKIAKNEPIVSECPGGYFRPGRANREG